MTTNTTPPYSAGQLLPTARAALPIAFAGLLFVTSATTRAGGADAKESGSGEQRLLYVASPGVRDLLEYGGHGVLVFAIDDNHRFLRRIPFAGLGPDGRPLNVKGICASARTRKLYISTLMHLICIDLVREQVDWQHAYDGGCDRMAIAPSGEFIYLPSLEKDHWHVVDASTGKVVETLVTKSASHNTVYGADGRRVYMAGLQSPLVSIADTNNHTIVGTVGPFAQSVRPFTVNGRQTLLFACVNDLLGFEIGELSTGRKIHRVEVAGYQKGPVKRHGCPSHGVGLTPDERELWLTDATNQCLHLFDATQMPPKQLQTIPLRDEPGWVTFTVRGDLAYPSTGEVIDTQTRKIVAQLTDEKGRAVQSEKMLEIDWSGDMPIRNGDQFGVGRQ